MWLHWLMPRLHDALVQITASLGFFLHSVVQMNLMIDSLFHRLIGP